MKNYTVLAVHKKTQILCENIGNFATEEEAKVFCFHAKLASKSHEKFFYLEEEVEAICLTHTTPLCTGVNRVSRRATSAPCIHCGYTPAKSFNLLVVK